MVGLGRLELPTSRLSGVRSNHLSYRPIACAQDLQPQPSGAHAGGSLSCISNRQIATV